MKVCSVLGCNSKHLAKGLCSLHYGRLKRTGSLEKTTRKPKPKKICSVLNCTNIFYAKELCRYHYDKKRNASQADLLKQRNKEYYQKNKDRIKLRHKKATPEQIRMWARKRRSKKKNSIHIPYTEEEVLTTYGILCYLCGEEIDIHAPRRTGLLGWENGLHIDHVVLIKYGGSDSLENVRPSHGICNLSRSK